jgi:hypothetical protein
VRDRNGNNKGERALFQILDEPDFIEPNVTQHTGEVKLLS